MNIIKSVKLPSGRVFAFEPDELPDEYCGVLYDENGKVLDCTTGHNHWSMTQNVCKMLMCLGIYGENNPDVQAVYKAFGMEG